MDRQVSQSAADVILMFGSTLFTSGPWWDESYAIVGMSEVFAGAVRAPLTAIRICLRLLGS
jgi:H+/Cl- antiporter ClcA